MELPTVDADRARQPSELKPSAQARTGEPVNRPGDSARPEVTGPPQSIREREQQRWVDRLAKLENPPTNRTELKARLDQLEPGHPSSPWQEDGSPKPPVPRLSEFGDPVPPLSDADYKAHVRDVVRGLGHAALADPPIGAEHSIDGEGQIWTPERNKVHAEIASQTYVQARDVPCDRIAIIAGGLGGAGKTTVLKNFAGIDLSQYLMINPDDFKQSLAERGLVENLPNVSPMETTTLYHEESSDIARRLSLRAMADGKNVIWDITMSSEGSTARRIQELKDAGYDQISAVFVDIPVETSLTRSEERHRRGHDQYLAGMGLGGRYVPPDLIQEKADAEFGTTNRRTFEQLKDQFASWSIYDNSVDGRQPVLVDRKPSEVPEREV